MKFQVFLLFFYGNLLFMRFLILFIFIYLVIFQVKANEPDLTMFDTSLQRDIKNACITIKYNDGLVPYFECLEKNKKEIIEYGKRPDLSMFDTSLQRDIKNACNLIKYNDGIIPYFDCVSKEITKLEKYFNPEDVSQDDLEDTDKLKLYLTGHVCNLDQPIEFLKEKALNFYNEEKYEDTFKCSLAGALLNDPYSNGILGWHYQFGIGIEENLSKSNFWYEKGVILDDNYSKVNLAKNLSEGIGLPVNQTRAFQLVKENLPKLVMT